MPAAHSASRPPLYGLALCGGRGTRLGADKGSLDYHGRPQAHWLCDLLAAVCDRVFLSLRADQAGQGVYADLPAIVDRPDVGGPAAGLLAAWDRIGEVAWLVVAADMPLIDPPLLATLVQARDPRATATAFRHPDGTPEPLCTIWEPRARALVEAARPRFSLRDVLAAADTKLVDPADPSQLRSVNTPEDDRAVRARLDRTAPTR